ncbi:Lipid carrier : UDP-N-acetylgalactosaminyltransferase [hydrothermal vent metagenome]|uniref:Lipid carrier: UDP-N-acetylgalactosaminyltransferase n=1 Tax=hydrothermal vent metagenome TaxID=652676 RepID=A0A3B1DU23_9ZZZZ
MKRFFDISCSFIGLIILLPLFTVVAILIKFDSRGPVFFRQQRIGKNFRPFRIYKFRTMTTDAPEKGPEITVGGDKRVTRIGRILRKYKLDELPQLINVLMGDMSLVGPRPEVEKYVELYKEDYKHILQVRPGITDISSITYRDEEGVLVGKKDPEAYYRQVLLPEKIRLAREYIARASFFYDLRLIFKTVHKIFYPSFTIQPQSARSSTKKRDLN